MEGRCAVQEWYILFFSVRGYAGCKCDECTTEKYDICTDGTEDRQMINQRKTTRSGAWGWYIWQGLTVIEKNFSPQ